MHQMQGIVPCSLLVIGVASSIHSFPSSRLTASVIQIPHHVTLARKCASIALGMYALSHQYKQWRIQMSFSGA
jgi:hypothetical protein